MPLSQSSSGSGITILATDVFWCSDIVIEIWKFFLQGRWWRWRTSPGSGEADYQARSSFFEHEIVPYWLTDWLFFTIVVVLVGHIAAGQFSSSFLSRGPSVPPYPAEEVLVIITIVITTIIITIMTMMMIRRSAEEGGFRPVEWRWSGLPQVTIS